MIGYFVRGLWTQVRQRTSLYVLTVFGVTLGVAAVLAIQVINQNALAAFRGSMEALSGSADLTVLGRLPAFPESLYTRVLAQPGVARAWPLHRVDVAVVGVDDLFLEIVGIDVLRPVDLPLESAALDPAHVLTAPGWIAVTPALAVERGWSLGDTLTVSSGTRRRMLTVGALVDFQRLTPLASRRLALMDIAQSQALFGRRGEISQIDIQLAPHADARRVTQGLVRALGPAVDVLVPEQRTHRAMGLMEAFRVNLTALSMISLVVGLFLVYAATQASLVRRRAEFGVLRSLGASRAQVFGLIMGDVVVLGVLGVCLGLPLGYAVAAANVDDVSATLTNLYVLDAIETLTLPASLYAMAAAVGVGGALVGALGPAVDMSRRDPVALLSAFTLHERLGSLVRPMTAAGLATLAAAGAWYALWGASWRPAGFVLAIALLVALPLLTPAAIRSLARPIRVRGFGMGFSVRSLTARLPSTAVAVAALALAVTMLTGITVMVGSFRRTVATWVDTTVRADVYVTTPTWARAFGTAPLDTTIATALRETQGVIAMDRLRGFFAVLEDGQRISVFGVDLRERVPPGRFPLASGDRETALQRVRGDGAVLISEPLARKRRLGVGDTIRLTTPDGVAAFSVAGVYYDYATEAGAVGMDLATMAARFGSGPINSIALYLEPGRDADSAVAALTARFDDVPLLIRSNRRIREQALRLFDQTFAVTRVLQVMGLLIAVAGVTLTLLVTARERVSELALYRALGAARRQIFTIFVGKGLAMGTVAILLGLGGGLVLAAILIFVVNRSYFGWTIRPSLPAATLIEQAASILVATIVASAYPALRAARTPATELSRDDV